MEIFDIKKFVSEAKRKQMLENSPKIDNNANLFNPFQAPNDFPNPFINPFMSNSFPTNKETPKDISNLSSADIDRMIADIDKKIKELDEQEQEEKKNQKITKETPKEEEQESKPKINIDTDSVVMNDSVITDDEFFDDFFGDE